MPQFILYAAYSHLFFVQDDIREKLKLEGKITKEAQLHIEIQKGAFRTVLMSIKGLGLIAVENTINAALGAVAKTVNKAIGWGLL